MRGISFFGLRNTRMLLANRRHARAGSSGTGGDSNSGGGSGGGMEPEKRAPEGIWGWIKSHRETALELFRSYGTFAVIVHLSFYSMTLLGMWGLVAEGFVSGPDVNTYLNNWEWLKQAMDVEEFNVPPHVGEFATAWLLTKTTEPVRLLVTGVTVPVFARYLPDSALARLGLRRGPRGRLWRTHSGPGALPKPERRSKAAVPGAGAAGPAKSDGHVPSAELKDRSQDV